MNRKEQILTVAMAAILIFGLSVWAVLRPADEFSESERRPLEQFPEITLSSVLSGDFMDDFEGYTNDQFPMRDTFRGIKALAQYYLFGLSDNNGLYFADGQVAKLDFPLKEDSIENAASRFTELYETYMKGKAEKIVFAHIPDKGFYLGEANGYPVMDYKKLDEMLSEKLYFADYISLAPFLSAKSYYAADTHWMQQELLPAADEILSRLGAGAFDNLEEKTATESFHGVYYGQSALPLKPEKIIYLENPELSAMKVFNHETGKTGGIYDFEKLSGNDPYEFYLSGPVSLLEVENPGAEGGRHLIIFRDSFGSSIAPLLMKDYSKITLIDTRYLLPGFIGNYVDFEGADVLMIYSSLVLNNSSTLRK